RAGVLHAPADALDHGGEQRIVGRVPECLQCPRLVPILVGDPQGGERELAPLDPLGEVPPALAPELAECGLHVARTPPALARVPLAGRSRRYPTERLQHRRNVQVRPTLAAERHRSPHQPARPVSRVAPAFAHEPASLPLDLARVPERGAVADEVERIPPDEGDHALERRILHPRDLYCVRAQVDLLALPGAVAARRAQVLVLSHRRAAAMGRLAGMVALLHARQLCGYRMYDRRVVAAINPHGTITHGDVRLAI